MILDTSAIVAIVLAEPGFEEFEEKIERAEEIGVGTPTLLETAIVLSARTGRDQRRMLEMLLRRIGAVEIPFDAEHWRQANAAFWKFGKGRHRTGLNFGDCCAYAVDGPDARVKRECGAQADTECGYPRALNGRCRVIPT